MKYLFINSVSGFGSTGRIISDTCRELMAQGHECLIAYGRKDNLSPDIPSIRIDSQTGKVLHVLRTRLWDGQGFGSYADTKAFLRKVREYDPDVIWLHNLHGYYIHIGLLFDYLRSCGKEIRWTLHDCWAFTGHCTYFDFVGCTQWKTGCRNCPQSRTYPETRVFSRSRQNFAAKKALFTGIPNMQLYTPSYWLKQRVEQSFLRDYPISVLSNSVNPAIFHPVESTFKHDHGLDGKYMLLGVCSMWEPRKGLKDFIALSGMLPQNCKIVLIGLDKRQLSQIPPAILGLPRTANVQELVSAYSAADLYICPSVEETFGMTVLEAALCGTKSIVYQGTACEEVAVPRGGIAVPRGAENILNAIYNELEVTR